MGDRGNSSAVNCSAHTYTLTHTHTHAHTHTRTHARTHAHIHTLTHGWQGTEWLYDILSGGALKVWVGVIISMTLYGRIKCLPIRMLSSAVIVTMPKL